MAEQIVGRPIPDVVALQFRNRAAGKAAGQAGRAVARAPPKARFTAVAPGNTCGSGSNRITVRHRLGRVVAVINILSPGNKASGHAMRSFAEKTFDLLNDVVNLPVVNVFPPSRRDRRGSTR